MESPVLDGISDGSACAKTERIRLILLDSHGLFRVSLGRLLASEPGFDLVGECATGTEALEVLSRAEAEVVLLDDLTSEDGSEFIVSAQQAGYQGKFLVVTAAPDAKSAAATLKLGASGIFLTSEPPSRLMQAIRIVAGGQLWIDPRVIRLLAERCLQMEDQRATGVVTDREQKVLRGIVAGLTNRKIGEEIGISEASVKLIVQLLFGKAGVRRRSQLVRSALEGFGNIPR